MSDRLVFEKCINKQRHVCRQKSGNIGNLKIRTVAWHVTHCCKENMDRTELLVPCKKLRARVIIICLPVLSIDLVLQLSTENSVVSITNNGNRYNHRMFRTKLLLLSVVDDDYFFCKNSYRLARSQHKEGNWYYPCRHQQR